MPPNLATATPDSAVALIAVANVPANKNVSFGSTLHVLETRFSKLLWQPERLGRAWGEPRINNRLARIKGRLGCRLGWRASRLGGSPCLASRFGVGRLGCLASRFGGGRLRCLASRIQTGRLGCLAN